MSKTPRWQTIPDTNGRYEVSDQGQLRRLGLPLWVDPETGMTHRQVPPKLIKPMRSLSGFLMAEMSVDGQRVRRNLADVVGQAFHGPIDPKTHQYLLVEGSVELKAEVDAYRADPANYRADNIELRKRVERKPTDAALKAAAKHGITL